ncbi:MAG: hypothetical protein HYU66_28460 [Armatimonadetes bacterium]|nr:hypothetical protein [Armatimonadota bacterium]
MFTVAVVCMASAVLFETWWYRRCIGLSGQLQQVASGVRAYLVTLGLPTGAGGVEVDLSLFQNPAAELDLAPLGPSERGRTMAQQRHLRFQKVSRAREGTVLLSETLEPLHEDVVAQVEDAANSLVLVALACTILGLFITILSLSWFRAAEGVGSLGPLAFAFIPTFFGLFYSWCFGQFRGSPALNAWHSATEALDQALIDQIVHARGDGLSQEEATKLLGSAATQLQTASAGLSGAVNPFSESVGKLSEAVSTLDTSAVVDKMDQAANRFSTALDGSSEQLGLACTALSGISDSLKPRTDELHASATAAQTASGQLSDTVRAMAEALGKLREAGNELVRAFQPAVEVATQLRSNQEQLDRTSGEMRDHAASLDRAVSGLTVAIHNLGAINQPVASQLTGTAQQLEVATTQFRNLVTDLQNNQEITRQRLEEVSAAMRGSSADLASTTTGWQRLIDRATLDFDQFTGNAIGALQDHFREQPEDIVRLVDAAERLAQATATLEGHAGALQGLVDQQEAALRVALQGFQELVSQSAESVRQAGEEQQRALHDAVRETTGQLEQVAAQLQSAHLEALPQALERLNAAVGKLSQAAPRRGGDGGGVGDTAALTSAIAALQATLQERLPEPPSTARRRWNIVRGVFLGGLAVCGGMWMVGWAVANGMVPNWVAALVRALPWN